jgi:sister-chromatid-cohesion protein PDS5
MSQVLQYCVDESEDDDIDQELLDLLLSPLLPAAKQENVAAFNLVGTVLRRAKPSIRGHISSFVNRVLVGTGPHMDKVSELSDHIYPLIFELHRIDPDLLLRVLPNVCEQLKAEEEEVRVRAVKLLGRLFASSSADYGEQFARSFREFLGRFVDVAISVRMEMVDQSLLVMKRKPALREAIEEPLVKRLQDSEPEIRYRALNVLLEIGTEDPLLLSPDSFKALGARIRDRKENIHSRAVRGLAQIYGKFVSSVLPPLSALGDGENIQGLVRPELLARLNDVPKHVVSYWGLPDLKHKHTVCHLLQESLLPKLKADASGAPTQSQSQSQSQSQTSSSRRQDTAAVDGCRASALLLLFSLLEDEVDKKKNLQDMLGTILAFKARVRHELSSFLEARLVALASAKGSDGPESEMLLKSSMMRIYRTMPLENKKHQPLEKLHAFKDKTVFKMLAHALAPADSISETLRCREELKQRLDSKSTLSDYMAMAYDFSSHALCNSGMLGSLIESAENGGSGDDAMEVARLIALLAKHVNGIFITSASPLQDWLADLATKSLSSSKSSLGPRQMLIMATKAIEQASAGVAADPLSGELCSKMLEMASKQNDPATCELLAKTSTLLSFNIFKATSEAASSSAASDASNVKASAAVTHSISSLGSPKRLLASSARIHLDLLQLAALLQLPNRVCMSAAKLEYASDVQSPNLPKVRATLLGMLHEDIFVADFVEGKKDNKEAEEARRLTLVAAIKAWAAVLSLEEELRAEEEAATKVLPAKENRAITGVSLELNGLLDVLFEAIDSRGQSVAKCRVSSASTAASVFVAAASAAFTLLKLKHVGEGLSVSRWKKLAFTLVCDDEADVVLQSKLADQFFDILQTHPLHIRFLPYACLLTSTPPPLAEKAGRVLHFASSRLRRTHEKLQQMALADDGDSDEALIRKAQDNMPETAVPYLLYLLSYHPHFPQSQDVKDVKDEKRFKAVASMVRSLIKALKDSLAGEETNLSFLIKQVDIIAFHEDAHDSDNLGLDFVTVLTSKLLKELIKSDEHVSEYHGDIALPTELFTHKPDVSHGAVRRGGGAPVTGAATDYIETAGMDRILAKKVKGGPAQSRKRQAESAPAKEKKAKVAKTTTTKPKAAGNGKGKENAWAAEERPVNRPRRSAAAAVSYAEADENEQEAMAWDDAAGRSSLGGSRVAVSEEDDDDDDDGDDEKASPRRSVAAKAKPAARAGKKVRSAAPLPYHLAFSLSHPLPTTFSPHRCRSPAPTPPTSKSRTMMMTTRRMRRARRMKAPRPRARPRQRARARWPSQRATPSRSPKRQPLRAKARARLSSLRSDKRA